MEPLLTGAMAAVRKESAQILKKESAGFIEAVYGEPAKALGGLWADKLNARRHANLIKITVAAKRKLAEAGVSPAEVPLSIIHPALEAASLQEDPHLQEIWANLLANAAHPAQRAEVSAAFPLILKELGGRDVKWLEALYTDTLKRQARESSIEYSWDQLLDIYSAAGLAVYAGRPSLTTMQDYDENRTLIEADKRNFGFMMDLLRRNCILIESK
jgi:abortive infection alpha-like protein